MYLEYYCKKIYVSPTSEEKNNCGTISRKCKTLDDAVKVSLNDSDHTSVIILDGGETERNVYSVMSHNIEFSKSLLINGDPSSKSYPVIKSLGGISQNNYLFNINADDINISIQSVQMDNLAFVNTKKSRNVNLTVNDCYVKLKPWNYFISVAQNDKSVHVHFKDSSFVGNLKTKIRGELTNLMGQESNLIQLDNCSFEHADINIVRSSHVRVKNSFFINTAIFFWEANYLHIANSIFKNYLHASVNYSSLEIYKSNATFENCSFYNNKNYSIHVSKSILYLIELDFYNNTSDESTYLISATLSNVTLLRLEISSTNSNYSLINTEGGKLKLIDSAVVRNTMEYLIFCVGASDSEYPAADELKTGVNSLLISNTTISENHFQQDLVYGEIKGRFEVLYSLILNNTYSGESNFGNMVFSKYQLLISHTTIAFNSAPRFILCYGGLYMTHTRFSSNKVLFGIVTASIKLKSSKFEKNFVNGTLIDIEKDSTKKFSADSSEIENLTVSKNIIENNVIYTNSQRQDENIRIDGLKAIHNIFRSCFAISGGFTTISNSHVSENKANGLGKLVNFQSSCHTCNKMGLGLQNVFSFFNSTDSETVILYMQMVSERLSLENVTLDLPDTNGAVRLPVIEFERNQWMSKVSKDINLDVKIQCPYNYYPNSVSDVSNSASDVSNTKFVYQLSCISCARGLYSFNRGFKSLVGVTIGQKRYFDSTEDYIKNILGTEKPFSCHVCPAGGICESSIRSRGNFYGYVNKNAMVQFIPCPEHYCFSKEGVECLSYNTCNSYRTGTICGACMEGYFISYFSNKCIPISTCTGANRSLFWVLYITASLIFTIALCFAKDILVFCKKGLFLLKEKMCIQKQKVETCLSNLDHYGNVSEPTSKQTQTNFPKEISYSAIFNVLVSFYQLRSLLQIPVDDSGDSFYTSAISNIFNLNVMIQTADKYCPTRDTDAVYRDFLKNFLLPVFMISTILVALKLKLFFRFIRRHIFHGINQCNSKPQRRYLPLRKRFYVGFYVVVAFSYQKVSTFAFRLIHCVEINSENVLYIAGETKCYNTWQVLDMLFLAFWVIPFPASVSCSYHLLKKDKINVRVFMLCIILPPVTPLFYILMQCFPISIKARNCRHEKHIKTKFSERFEEPYRKNYFWWESWTLYERLIVGCLTTFLVDPVIRLFALTPALLLFLWIHIRAKPFKYTKSLLYEVDMASYICLCLSLVINVLRAVVYIYSLPSQHPIDQVLHVSIYLEHLFTPVWVLIIHFFVSLIRMQTKKTSF